MLLYVITGVRISVESDMHNSTESRTSFEGRDSSNKSKESSSRYGLILMCVTKIEFLY